MKKMLAVYAVFMLACTITVNAQNSKAIQRYIDKYRSLAMSEQQRTGIPASVKLAQGIHETGAGTSKLATEANNHFGLKCKSSWTGQTYNHTDDRPNECFRKYSMDFESYQDQSNYLKSNPRYASLFELSLTDYAGWAIGLRKAGYATNPKYPQLLINIIEEYHLQEYTYAAMNSNPLTDNIAATTPPANNNNVAQNNRQAYNNTTTPVTRNTSPVTTNPRYNQAKTQQAATPPAKTSVSQLATTISQPATNVETINTAPPARSSKYVDTRPRKRQTLARSTHNGNVVEQTVDENTYNVTKINNLRAVYGKAGDMPLQYAVRHGIRYEKFLEINDLEEQPLPTDMPLYLERKHFWGIRPMHLVKPGETMLVIAQKEGIQLKYLRDLNYMETYEEPMPGITLELQAQAAKKPTVLSRAEVEANALQNETAMQNALAPPVRTFPKNPAPAYEEEKPLWEKMKEKREARRAEKEQAEAATQTSNAPQQRPVQSYNRSQYSYSNTNVKPNPAAQNYNNTQPVTQPQATQNYNNQYAQSNTNVSPTPNVQYYNSNTTQQQQPVVQQPIESHSRTQYSYRNTNVTPNPAAQVVEEDNEKLSRRERRQLQKEEEEAPAVTTPQPAQQQPKSELDILKEQFDNVIYTQNTNAAPAPQNNNQQPQQRYQQPANSQQNYNQQQTYAQQPVQQTQTAPRVDPSKMYTVQRGDTAYTIAKKHGITIRQLMDWNGLDFDAIREGQVLRIKP